MSGRSKELNRRNIVIVGTVLIFFFVAISIIVRYYKDKDKRKLTLYGTKLEVKETFREEEMGY